MRPNVEHAASVDLVTPEPKLPLRTRQVFVPVVHLLDIPLPAERRTNTTLAGRIAHVLNLHAMHVSDHHGVLVTLLGVSNRVDAMLSKIVREVDLPDLQVLHVPGDARPLVQAQKLGGTGNTLERRSVFPNVVLVPDLVVAKDVVGDRGQLPHPGKNLFGLPRFLHYQEFPLRIFLEPRCAVEVAAVALVDDAIPFSLLRPRELCLDRFFVVVRSVGVRDDLTGLGFHNLFLFTVSM